MNVYPGEIAKAAQATRIPTKLIEAIIQVESGGNPWAIRHEPGFFAKYLENRPVVVTPPCNEETERRASRRWGKTK